MKKCHALRNRHWSVMLVFIRATSKIHQNILPRTKDATAVEEKDTSKRNEEVECKGVSIGAIEQFSKNSRQHQCSSCCESI